MNGTHRCWRRLNLLTGQDFGYDEATWRKWYNAQRNSAGAKKKKSKP